MFNQESFVRSKNYCSNLENEGSYQRNSNHPPSVHPNQQHKFLQQHSTNQLHAGLQQGPRRIFSNYQLIPRAELQKHVQSDDAPEELEAGVLADGRAYAQRDFRRQTYLLFPTRKDYILHFVHHYFSRENLARDDVIRDMMDSKHHHAVPSERIVDAPRLRAIGTTVDELEAAVAKESKVLLHFVGGDGRGYLRRIDGYSGGPNLVGRTSSWRSGRRSGDCADKRSESGAQQQEQQEQGPPMLDGHGHPSTTQPSSVYVPNEGIPRASNGSQALASLNASMAGMKLVQETAERQNSLRVPPQSGFAAASLAVEDVPAAVGDLLNAKTGGMAAGPQTMVWPPTHHVQSAPHQHHNHQAPEFSATPPPIGPPPQPSHAPPTAPSTAPIKNPTTTSGGLEVAGNNGRPRSYAEAAAASQAVKKGPSAAAAAAATAAAVPVQDGSRGSKKTTIAPSPAQSHQKEDWRPKSSTVHEGGDGKTSGGRATQEGARDGVRNNNKTKWNRSYEGASGTAAQVHKD